MDLKTSLSKGGGRKTRKRSICQVPILLSFAAKLQFSGRGQRKVSAFVYVKHQVCRVGKWEWRAGWRIFFAVHLDFGFPGAASAVTELSQEVVLVHPPFEGICSARHKVQCKK